MKNLLFFLMSIITAVVTAQTPCVSGMAGTYPCSGFDLLSFTPSTAFNAQNANDSMGLEYLQNEGLQSRLTSQLHRHILLVH